MLTRMSPLWVPDIEDSILYRWKGNKIHGTCYDRGQRLGFELLIGSCR